MGHTLVAVLSEKDEIMISSTVKKVGVNAPKIPFGRNCDRYAADMALPYHITLFHWARLFDRDYLPFVEGIPFIPCKAVVTGSDLMYAEEGSLLLYLSIQATPSFDTLQKSITHTFGTSTNPFLHMTLAVSQDHEDIRRIQAEIDKSFRYPFEIDIKGVHLYHIWDPVVRVFPRPLTK